MIEENFDARRIDPRIRLAMRVLEFEQTLVPSLEDLASRVGLSPFRLAHLFKEDLGESVAAYGRRIRLDNSINQMIHDTASMDGIAATFGYKSQAAYTRAFTRQFGMSPRQYVTTILGRTQHDYAASHLNPVDGASGATLIDNPVRLIERPGQPALARRFYGYDVGTHWQRFLAELPPGLAESGSLAVMGHDNARVTPARHWRIDCAVVFERWPADRDRLSGAAGLDPVELPGGLHAEFAVTDGLLGLWKASIGLLTEWLPAHPEYMPEGDPLVSWVTGPPAPVPATGIATIRIRPRGTSPAYNLPPLTRHGGPAGSRTDPSEA